MFLLLGFKRGCSFKQAIGAVLNLLRLTEEAELSLTKAAFDRKSSYTLHSLLCIAFNCDFG
jgi:hypothetical protein